MQALDRTAPILPIRPSLPEKRSHDYVRHGTTTLFAALNVATGQVTDACHERHRHQEFLAFGVPPSSRTSVPLGWVIQEGGNGGARTQTIHD